MSARYLCTRYPTLYELAASHDDGRRLLVAYCRRKGRTGLWHAITSDDRRDTCIAVFGTSSIDFAKRTADGARMGAWTIRFTGRTARDCRDSELPFISDDPKAVSLVTEKGGVR